MQSDYIFLGMPRAHQLKSASLAKDAET